MANNIKATATTTTEGKQIDIMQFATTTATTIMQTATPQTDLQTVINELLAINTKNATTHQKTQIAKRILKLCRWYNTATDIIDDTNIFDLSRKITNTALNSIYGSTANGFILDILHNKNDDFNVIANGVALYLTLYKGKTPNTLATVNTDDGNGNKLVRVANVKTGTQANATTTKTHRILKECLHTYINTLVKRAKKIAMLECWLEKPQTVNGANIDYIDDFDAFDDFDIDKTQYIKIDKYLHIDNIDDFEKLQNMIDGLQLTPHQAKILKYRLDGIAIDDSENTNGKTEKINTSKHTISLKLGVSRQAIIKTIAQIEKKLINYATATGNTALLNSIARATAKRK